MAGRFYKIYVPIRHTGILYGVGLAIGLILAIVAGLAITIVILGMMNTSTNSN
jgi:hypothetical protein